MLLTRKLNKVFSVNFLTILFYIGALNCMDLFEFDTNYHSDDPYENHNPYLSRKRKQHYVEIRTTTNDDISRDKKLSM